MRRYKENISGLHIQWPWSQLIISGKKTVETRSYALPKKYIGTPLAIIETPGRKKSAAGFSSARIVGVVIFSGSFRYNNEVDWKNDYHRHQVSQDDESFSFDKNHEKWGWEIESVHILNQHVPPPKKRGIVFALNCKV